MLTIFRSNRAEFLVDLLGRQLQLAPPPPLQEVQVVVNTWPTSRWLGEQLALRLGGVVAHLRCPFPASHLASIVDALLERPSPSGPDPWRASQLVWPLLELLPSLADSAVGEPLRRWLDGRGGGPALDLGTWQLGRAIADAFDDYALYRPELLAAWEVDQDVDGLAEPLAANQAWQPHLYRALRQRLEPEPFALRAERAIARLRLDPQLPPDLPERLGGGLRLFGLSSLAPLQVRLLQALSGSLPVDLFLLTPCGDLWQRCRMRRQELRDALALHQPLDGEWLRQAPALEARFGRLGAEFQQLLEGTGEAQLGEQQEADLFFRPAEVSEAAGADPPPLLLQLQEQLVDPQLRPQLRLAEGDHSLEFHPCPGPMRQVQIVRDRLLQLLADDDQLEPRDILVMTPQVEEIAPLLAAVFSDTEATGVALPWRLTDRTQQAEAGLASTLLTLLQLASERLSASGLERLLSCRPLQQHFELDPAEIARLHRELQRLGFRWGLDAVERGGDGTHSLSWAMDRLLLSLVLPPTPGLALGLDGAAAPAEGRIPVDLVGRWLHLLQRLRHWLRRLSCSRDAAAWAELLRQLVADLFGEAGEAAAELPPLLTALADGLLPAAGMPQELEVAVIAAVLEEALAADSGRFGHRSGALTISALEPMRAIPHKVIVLMGLDAASFPRQRLRPGFHLMARQRQLGDADPADQDRYILLEALLSARQRLLITWSSRDERTGEALPPAAPLRQWIDWLDDALEGRAGQLLVSHSASPLERVNFLPADGRPPASCDRRLLQARLALDRGGLQAPRGLAFSPPPAMLEFPAACAGRPVPGDGALESSGQVALETLRAWLMHPQRHWLEQLGMRPREWQERMGDLEGLELEERQRTTLLREAWEQQLAAAATPQGPEDWLHRQRGRGRLPALAAGLLEVEELERRWRSLQACLADLGDSWSQMLQWGTWQHGVAGRGEALLLVHCGRATIAQQLSLWLDLLLASVAAPEGHKPLSGVLISRGKGSGYEVTTRLSAPEPEAAVAELERLSALYRQQGTSRCWPAPPRTGWAWLEAEQTRPGSGAQKAAQIWEGGQQLRGEREDEAMVICFGAQLAAAELLKEPFEASATALYQPLWEALEARPVARRRS